MAFDAQGRGGASGNDDLYEILGLSPDAPPDEVDAAYHRLLNGLTTTSGTNPAAVENLRRRRIRLANAYAVLADEEQRAAYDARMGLQAAEAPPLAVTAPTASPPPMAMPEVHPRTEVPPVRMPQVTPRTEVPPMPMPEIQRPAPVRVPPKASTTAATVSTPLPAVPLAEPGVSSADAAAVREAAPVTPLVVAPVAAETLPDVVAPPVEAAAPDVTTPPVEAAAAEEPPEAAAAWLPDEAKDEDATPVDDTPAPWEPPTLPATPSPYPTVRPRPAPQRPAPSAPAPAPRSGGGVSLPSRKVAEATPLPAPRSRTAMIETPTRPLSDDEDMDDQGSRVRPAARSSSAPARQRALTPAPVRRTPRKSRTNVWQTVFYGAMAVILVIGTFAGIASSIITPLGTTAPTVSAPTDATQADAQADALLAAGNYSAAITLYNQVLTNTNGSDAKALLGLAKAYFYKTPSEPDIAREYLARVFTAAGGTNSPEGQEALQLLGTIGLPSSPGAGTPGAGTPGTGSTPGTGGTSLPATTGATSSTPLPATSGATGGTPLPATQPVPATSAPVAPGGAPAAGTSSPNK